MSINVCFIVGDSKITHCGVKDYAQRLASALASIGVIADLHAAEPWSTHSFFSLCRKLRNRKYDLVHIQFPSIGYRRSLFPYILGKLGIAPATLVTIHEYSALPLAQRVCTNLFRWTTDQTLFVTQFEQTRYNRVLRNSGSKQWIIPIGSNVPEHPVTLKRTPTILYFGQIRPHKGLEDFVELARMQMKQQTMFRFVIAGSVPTRHKSYFDEMQAATGELVEWQLNLAFTEVAELMACSLAAYLPFPDGASNRRGSLLAALSNGLPVISTIGPASAGLADVLLAASTPAQAYAHIQRLHDDAGHAHSVGSMSKARANNFQWPEIAQMHRQLYEDAFIKTSHSVRGKRNPGMGPPA